MSNNNNPVHGGGVRIYICTACDYGNVAHIECKTTGQHLFDQVVAVCGLQADVEVVPVECLAVCDRPVTVAYQAPKKWSYVLGGVDPTRDADDVLAAAKAIANSVSGIPSMSERPSFFLSGVISRLPPTNFSLPSND
ncbi:MAG: hypothetical protein CL398_06240 [Acidiferrobacteraceae bacterium]|nr:hypothetical protein [Acidiferrobacteraceae bacterium]|tara:strand:- start:13532 stop:13942 length:411 start_codon:yes stop_codon:yes gene_type:complete